MGFWIGDRNYCTLKLVITSNYNAAQIITTTHISLLSLLQTPLAVA
jgi:hypothetical protein